jgi:hypothetical protein
MKLLIDDHLDTISRFSHDPRLFGSKLTWFQNGPFRDIKLVYRGRLLKVYINIDENDLISVMTDAESVLRVYINKDNSR